MRRTSPRLKIGLAILAAFIILGGILPFFSPEDPRSWITHPRNLPPSAEHLLGTTNLGQDTFWLMSYATQNSLFIGVFVAFLRHAYWRIRRSRSGLHRRHHRPSNYLVGGCLHRRAIVANPHP